MYGKWTLLSQTQAKREGATEIETASEMPGGSYTFFVTPPEGAASTLRLYRGDTELKTVDRAQMSFIIQDGETLRIIVNHVFTRVGTVSVQSDPSGIAYILTGPNEQKYEGTTPQSYENVPEGQYTVKYEPLQGCVKAAPKSLYLEKNKRVSFSLQIVCEEADRMRNTVEPDKERFVTVTIDKEETIFSDVPQEAWFAPYVFNVARKNVFSGYRDKSGNLTGVFGPGNNVTVAELAKVVHRLAGIEEGSGEPENVSAKGQWYAAFIASAEKLGWTIYSDAVVDPNRPATRGEVLVTLLQALDHPVTWQRGEMFTDVTAHTPFAAAIETAADLEIVSGTQDVHGSDTGLFGPQDPINRAEMAKIIDKAMTILRVGGSSSSARGS